MTVYLFVRSSPRVGKAAAELSVGVVGDLHIDQRKMKDYEIGHRPTILLLSILGSFGVPYEVIDGNHDLERFKEFAIDEDNLKSFEFTWTITSTLQM